MDKIIEILTIKLKEIEKLKEKRKDNEKRIFQYTSQNENIDKEVLNIEEDIKKLNETKKEINKTKTELADKKKFAIPITVSPILFVIFLTLLLLLNGFIIEPTHYLTIFGCGILFLPLTAFTGFSGIKDMQKFLDENKLENIEKDIEEKEKIKQKKIEKKLNNKTEMSKLKTRQNEISNNIQKLLNEIADNKNLRDKMIEKMIKDQSFLKVLENFVNDDQKQKEITGSKKKIKIINIRAK